MSNEEIGIDAREATKNVRQYFEENYGAMGVLLFEIDKTEYNKTDKSWTITCNFFRTFASTIKSYYTVIVNSNGSLGSVNKITKPSE